MAVKGKEYPHDSLTNLRRFLRYLWPKNRRDLKTRLLLALVMVLFSKAIILLMPFAYKGVIDHMTAPEKRGTGIAMALAVAYAASRFGSVLFDNLRNAIFEAVGQNAAKELSVELFKHLHDLPLSFHLERRTGSLTRIIERGTKSIDSMLYYLIFNIGPTIFELIATCIIFVLSGWGWGMVMATLAMIAIYILFTRIITEKRVALRREWTEYDQQAGQYALDSLLNYETVKYFNAESLETKRYSKIATRLSDATVKVESSLAFLNIGQSLITNILMAGSMIFTVWGWSHNRFSVGDVVLINSLLLQLFRPLDFLGTVYRQVRQGLTDMAAVFRLIDTKATLEDKAHAPALQIKTGELRFEHVQFQYHADRPILKDIDFILPAGQSLAIVGSSGAGKSTLVRLLYRFYDVTGGRILIDHQDIREVTQHSLRQILGMVPQDIVLFNDTIEYNIRYGRPNASFEEVRQAARGAAISDFIDSLPQGYQTTVGERGLKLSGGEKQRIAIARMLLKNPPILLFDEATSALDSHSEADIQATLNQIAQNRTTIIIAHRLSTIVHADQIIVLDHGRIAERGNHQILLAQNGLYATMWKRQSQKG
ncbi:ABC transporter related protein [Zymomonas mobilis subsp. mobilis ZM4 = ATCC 31821]|uniref:ABC transporter related protein n=2 Tax=Zymomonas mobilis TaxID=542 RepID=Q5NMC4_ZYMMO|nr:ABC transporter ATP-binding protein/permease [Zymomonas mobilis]AAV90136.1 ABC transporter related protein [Zymomonas mobilis subsp. mobilis ZM4 = ATCC 31821]AVZ26353.1 ABC transporter related protein [Zymomonas mobilis subsp. mobilis]AVZ28240.1 ABC transporter related protein [Zymomonas mobilis subsp. mobilis]AVZ42685.1 ABC transporter related protein [Zymomonas mobilis subsp. mobilis ZM4 = ATCC 31821]UBQ07448.1 ABC transporter ATP-binding protein/permease [Zymomonas mobilis]